MEFKLTRLAQDTRENSGYSENASKMTTSGWLPFLEGGHPFPFLGWREIFAGFKLSRLRAYP
jgi:hypothetical protein